MADAHSALNTRHVDWSASTAVCELHCKAHVSAGLQGALRGNKQKRTESDLITVEDIVKHHWQEFGRSAAQMVPQIPVYFLDGILVCVLHACV